MNSEKDSLISLYSDDNLFELYLGKITDEYLKNPDSSKEKIFKYVDLAFDGRKDEKVKVKANLDILYMICLCFGIVLLGLFDITRFPMYFFGCVFFFAGMLIGIFVKGFGIIFLFSHGMSGYGMMLSCFKERIFNPLYSDVVSVAYIALIAVIAILSLCGLVFAIMNNLSFKNTNKNLKLYPFIFFGGAILVCALFPYLFKLLDMVL